MDTGPETLPTGDLSPYEGVWEFQQAAHLLRRTTFGPLPDDINWAIEAGLQEVLKQLFEEKEPPSPPMNHYFETDPFVPVGTTWIDAPYLEEENIKAYRKQSLEAWTTDILRNEGISLREKMTLFWHNHFSIANVNDPKYVYRYTMLLRTFAWGNFKELIQKITIEPAMLRFLNGNQNTKRAPNENYARELLELYTVGKGDLAGPGDYTTFTEKDVEAIARVLTGWEDFGFDTKEERVAITVAFDPEKHETAPKQLSHRFNNTIITNLDDQEYIHLIDIIFLHEEAARFICRKLYRWFVYYEIDETIESTIILPMAQTLVENNFEIKPVLEQLFSSQHFYDILSVGPMIKNPIDFVISSLKQTYAEIPEESLNEKYLVLQKISQRTRPMQMEYYDPPTVSGWSAYYQAPAFYRFWINATTMRERMGFASQLAGGGLRFSGLKIQSNPFKMLEFVEEPLDPNSLIKDFAKFLYPLPLEEHQYLALKEVLIPGLPDFEWTVEYGLYLENPEDADLKKSVETKLRQLLGVMINMAEFHLS